MYVCYPLRQSIRRWAEVDFGRGCVGFKSGAGIHKQSLRKKTGSELIFLQTDFKSVFPISTNAIDEECQFLADFFKKIDLFEKKTKSFKE
jgi:hypothetical protein